MEKEIYQALLDIKEELQAIRSSLEHKGAAIEPISHQIQECLKAQILESEH